MIKGEDTMRLGFFTCSERGQAERLMLDLAETLRQAERPVVGLVAEPHVEDAKTKVVRLLPSGQRINIWQDLGRWADGCRLDAGALETAVEITRPAIETAAPGTVVLVNKFGKHETEEGGGTRVLISTALEADLSVLLPVPPDSREAFEAFAGDLAEEVAPHAEALEAFAEGDS